MSNKMMMCPEKSPGVWSLGLVMVLIISILIPVNMDVSQDSGTKEATTDRLQLQTSQNIFRQAVSRHACSCLRMLPFQVLAFNIFHLS